MKSTAVPDARDIFGAEIQYFRLDPRHWESVLDRFVETGLRCVTSYVPWSVHLSGPPDPAHPAGVFDFEGRTDSRKNLLRFLDLVTERGLDLNFRSGPFCCNEMIYGGYPGWLVLGDPSMMVWDYQNRTTQGYWIGKREGSQPSYLHPGYLDLVAKWFEAVAPIIIRYRKAQGGCITMINLDNEVSYIVKDSFLDSDYNPVNVRPGGFYHQFLAGKYGNAGSLPYDRRYSAIEDVAAPREVPGEIGRNFAYYADWMEFKTWAMCRYITRLREMHVGNGVTDVRFMTNFNPHLPEGVPTRMPDFEEATGPGGIAGYDFYRGAFLSYSGYHSMARVLKLMNATLRFSWSAEFMSGIWNRDFAKVSRVSDDHMRHMARCALAHGCKAISWFMFHDRDAWGDTPVSTHGHARPSLEVLTETPRLLFEKLQDWNGLRPCADVAVIYDPASHMHTAIGDPSPCDDQAIYVGTPVMAGVEAGMASREYAGLFRLIEQAGVQAAVIDPVHGEGTLGALPLAFLPGSPVIRTETHDLLRAWVEDGGCLVVSGCWPRLVQDGSVRPLFGIQTPGDETALGRGRIVWSREYLGQDASETETTASREFVAALVNELVPRPRVRLRVAGGPVTYVEWKESGGGHCEYRQERLLGSAVLHRSETEQVVFVMNHYIDAVEFVLAFGDQRLESLECLDSGEVLPVEKGEVLVDVDRKSTRIFLVRRQNEV